MRVDESNFATLQTAYDITGSTNMIYWRDAENIDGYINDDDVMNLMEDLINEYLYVKEELRDLENKDEEPDFYDYWQDQQLEEGKL